MNNKNRESKLEVAQAVLFSMPLPVTFFLQLLSSCTSPNSATKQGTDIQMLEPMGNISLNPLHACSVFSHLSDQCTGVLQLVKMSISSHKMCKT